MFWKLDWLPAFAILLFVAINVGNLGCNRTQQKAQLFVGTPSQKPNLFKETSVKHFFVQPRVLSKPRLAGNTNSLITFWTLIIPVPLKIQVVVEAFATRLRL